MALAALGVPGAVQAGAAIIPFAEFVSSLGTASADAYVGRPGTAVRSAAAFEEMRQHLRNLYGDVSVAHSFEWGGQVFDCIPIESQPGLGLRQPNPLSESPPSAASAISPEHENHVPFGGAVQEGARKVGARAGAPRCGEGTIPMRRLTLDELTRFATLTDYLAK